MDCQTNARLTPEVLPSLDEQTPADETLGLDLSFQDPYRPQQDCRPESLNKDLVWGSPHDCDQQTNVMEADGTPAFTIWDCDAGWNAIQILQLPKVPPIHSRVDDAIQNHVSERNVGLPLPPGIKPSAQHALSGSYYEGFQHTARACLFERGLWMPWDGILNPMEPPIPGWNPIASGASPQAPEPKRRPDTFFWIPPCCGHRWEAKGETVSGVWQTHYIHLGELTRALFSIPSSSGGIYGAEACQGATSGIRNGWDCSPGRWGGPVKPGMTYHLRDVDCDEDGADSTPADALLRTLEVAPSPCEDGAA